MIHDAAYAQVDANTLESIATETKSMNGVPRINVDGTPRYIFGDNNINSLYVTNFEEDKNGSVSAIDTTMYDVKNIPVGDLHIDYSEL